MIDNYPSEIADFHERLGLERGASDEEIWGAYRKLAKAWHPDANPSERAHEEFIAVSEAYESLTDRDEYQKIFKDFDWEGERGFEFYDKMFNEIFKEKVPKSMYPELAKIMEIFKVFRGFP